MGVNCSTGESLVINWSTEVESTPVCGFMKVNHKKGWPSSVWQGEEMLMVEEENRKIKKKGSCAMKTQQKKTFLGLILSVKTHTAALHPLF